MITCGRCTRENREGDFTLLIESRVPVQHATVADVRDCHAAPRSVLARALDSFYEAEARAELEAEARNERFWENRGADDGFEEWEARQGLLSYEAARDLAEGR